MPDSNIIPDISTLQRLPYLHAFIQEGRYSSSSVELYFRLTFSLLLGLRVYGAAPSLLERVVPVSSSQNDIFSAEYDLMGFALPPGTVVGTQGWTMHRDPAVFPSPDTFLPERWLEEFTSLEHLSTMNQYLMPFGAGARICGGRNLAQIMLRVVMATMVRNFDITAPPETTEKSMEMKDSFVCFNPFSLIVMESD